MAGYISQNLRFLVGKLETGAGTPAEVTSADFDVRIREPEITYEVEMDDENSKWARGDHGEDASISGIQTAQVTFSIRCCWSGTVNVAPNWGKFMEACGQKTNAYASAGIGYQPRKENDTKTITLWVFDCQMGATPSAVLTKIKGAMGNCVIGADGVGKPWLATFTFQGVVDSVTDIAEASWLKPMGMDTTCSDKMLSNVAFVGTVPEKISSFTLDFGNELNPVYDQASSAGVAYYCITARRPRITMNPLAQLVATRNVWGQLTSGLTGCPDTFRIGIGDTGLNNKFWIQAPRAQLLSSAIANREGLVNWDQSYKLLANGTTGALTDSTFAEEVTFEILQGKRA